LSAGSRETQLQSAAIAFPYGESAGTADFRIDSNGRSERIDLNKHRRIRPKTADRRETLSGLY
jgi:hypothetical protein